MPTASGLRVRTDTHACTPTEWIHTLFSSPQPASVQPVLSPRAATAASPQFSGAKLYVHTAESKEKKKKKVLVLD